MDKYSKADKEGQEKVMGQLRKLFSGATLIVDQHTDDKSQIDIYITATTKSGKQYFYAIECKDRKYSHTYDNNWFIEVPKYENMMAAVEEGYKPLFINTFSDNWMTVWNLENVEIGEVKGSYRKSSVENRGKSYRTLYTLPMSGSVYSSSFVVV